MNTIVKIKFGSHLYGTNTPTSDLDYKSVYVPEGRDILLQRVQHSVRLGGRSKAEGERNTATDVDNECYSLQYYLQLLAEGQTGAIDMLFAPEPEVSSPLWKCVQANKDKLLTKKSAAFVGYCRTQANKYGIKGSRVAAAKAAYDLFYGRMLIHGPSVKLREFFGEEDEVFDEFTRTLRKETTQGRIERYYECCNRMVGFNNTLKEATSIYKRIHEAYGDRARLAQQNEGIDWKALSHAVRVGMEALELLTTGNITFPLPYAAHILDIKQGRIPYVEVADEIEHLLVAVERAAAMSTLRTDPDNEFIDNLVATMYSYQVTGEL